MTAGCGLRWVMGNRWLRGNVTPHGESGKLIEADEWPSAFSVAEVTGG